MRLVTVELVTLLVVGWVLALGALFVRYRRGEFGRRSGLTWLVVACFAVGWAFWQYDTLPETAGTTLGAVAPWVGTACGMAGLAVAVALYRTRPDADAGRDEADDAEQS